MVKNGDFCQISGNEDNIKHWQGEIYAVLRGSRSDTNVLEKTEKPPCGLPRWKPSSSSCHSSDLLGPKTILNANVNGVTWLSLAGNLGGAARARCALHHDRVRSDGGVLSNHAEMKATLQGWHSTFSGVTSPQSSNLSYKAQRIPSGLCPRRACEPWQHLLRPAWRGWRRTPPEWKTTGTAAFSHQTTNGFTASYWRRDVNWR